MKVPPGMSLSLRTLLWMGHLVGTSIGEETTGAHPHALSDGGFTNCGDMGNVTQLLMSDCDTFPCFFWAGQELRLEYAFLSTESVPRLDFDLSVIELGGGGERFGVRRMTGVGEILAGKVYESYLRFTLNSTLPPGKSWDMEILRSFEERRICARFPIFIDYIPPPPTTTTTTTTSEPEEPSPTTTTTTTQEPPDPPGFECEAEGLFPDPVDCVKYHACLRFQNGTWWDQEMSCPETTVWCQDILNCVYSLTCPCPRSYYD